jgi:hypothetical protein
VCWHYFSFKSLCTSLFICMHNQRFRTCTICGKYCLHSLLKGQRSPRLYYFKCIACRSLTVYHYHDDDAS